MLWERLLPIIERYTPVRDFRPYNLVQDLVDRRLFEKLGEQRFRARALAAVHRRVSGVPSLPARFVAHAYGPRSRRGLGHLGQARFSRRLTNY